MGSEESDSDAPSDSDAEHSVSDDLESQDDQGSLNNDDLEAIENHTGDEFE